MSRASCSISLLEDQRDKTNFLVADLLNDFLLFSRKIHWDSLSGAKALLGPLKKQQQQQKKKKNAMQTRLQQQIEFNGTKCLDKFVFTKYMRTSQPERCLIMEIQF